MKIQTEKKEWVMMEDGQLVQVAANKKHSQMKDNVVTDYLPNAYVFSNAKYMELHKDDFNEEIVSEKYPRYLEGKKPEQYKSITFAERYFSKNKQTPAEIISKIQDVHPIITDNDQVYNPFIQRANTLNKEYRQPAIDTIIKVSEFIKPEDTNTVFPDTEKNPQKFYYGGFSSNKQSNKNFIPEKAFLGLNALFDYFSNKRNKKEYERELANELRLGDEYRVRQIGHLDNQLMSSSVGALANFMPTERREDINLSEQKASATYEADRFAKRMNPEQARNQSIAQANTFARFAPNNPALGSVMSSAIASSNQVGADYNSGIADMDYRTGMAVSDMGRAEMEDRINNKFNYDASKRRNNLEGVTDLTNSYTSYQSGLASLDPYVIRQQIKDREYQKYMQKKAMSQAANQRYAAGIGDAAKAFLAV